MRFGADITRILPIRTDTAERWLGYPVLNLTRTGCSNFRLKFLRTRLVQRHRSLWSKRVKFKLKILLQIIGRSFCSSYNLRRRFSRFALNIKRNFIFRYDLRHKFRTKLKFTRTSPLFYSRSQYCFVDIASRYTKQESGYFAAFLSVSAARNRAINSSKLCAMSRASS